MVLGFASAQNYVQNGSFEQFKPGISCTSYIDSLEGWYGRQIEPRVLTQCFSYPQYTTGQNYWGYQMPRTGNNLGVVRMYLPTKPGDIAMNAVTPMEPYKVYTLDLWYSLCENSGYASDFMIVLYKSYTEVSSVITFSPDTTTSWNNFNQSLTPVDTIRYIGIGVPDSLFVNAVPASGMLNQAAYYIEDISITLDNVLNTEPETVVRPKYYDFTGRELRWENIERGKIVIVDYKGSRKLIAKY